MGIEKKNKGAMALVKLINQNGQLSNSALLEQ